MYVKSSMTSMLIGVGLVSMYTSRDTEEEEEEEEGRVVRLVVVVLVVEGVVCLSGL
jgi:hypothetical protein